MVIVIMNGFVTRVWTPSTFHSSVQTSSSLCLPQAEMSWKQRSIEYCALADSLITSFSTSVWSRLITFSTRSRLWHVMFSWLWILSLLPFGLECLVSHESVASIFMVEVSKSILSVLCRSIKVRYTGTRNNGSSFSHGQIHQHPIKISLREFNKSCTSEDILVRAGCRTARRSTFCVRMIQR